MHNEDDILGGFLDEFIMAIREHIFTIREILQGEEVLKSESIGSIFRRFHTIKGMSGFMQMITINKIAHKAEEILSEIRRGNLEFNKKAKAYYHNSISLIERVTDDVSLNSSDIFMEHLNSELDYEKFDKDLSFFKRDIEKELKVSKESLIMLEEDIRRLVAGLKDSEGNIANLNIALKIQNEINRLGSIDIEKYISKLKMMCMRIVEESGKSVNCEIFGEGIVLDRFYKKSITEIILHAVRNSLSHGIEDIDERLLKGKRAKGKIDIFFNRLSNIIIVIIKDDGRGMDFEKLRKRAVENKIVALEEDLEEKDILKLITTPEFTTKDYSDRISGRGIGFDVIKHKVEEMGGVIDIKNERDDGVEVIIKLPYKEL